MKKKTGGHEIMKEIKYIEIDGILYPDLKLPAQKEIKISKRT